MKYKVLTILLTTTLVSGAALAANNNSKSSIDFARAQARSNQIIAPVLETTRTAVAAHKAAVVPAAPANDFIGFADTIYAYPANYNGQSNFVLLNGYHGVARYLDKNSATIIQNDTNGFIFAENIIIVDMNENTRINSTYTQYYRIAKVNGLYELSSSLDQINWVTFKLDTENTSNDQLINNGFKQGYQLVTGVEYTSH